MSTQLNVWALGFALATLSATQPASAMQQSGDGVEAATSASVIVFNQKLDGSAVKLTYVYAPQRSFAVVYGADDKGQLSGKPFGSTAIEPGDHRDLKIPIGGDVKPGDALWISLHRTKGEATAFDINNDVSYWAGESLPSTNGFLVE
jgi:hypothetical protein